MEAILVKDQKAAAFVMEDGTFEGVYRITEKVCGDVEQVTGVRPKIIKWQGELQPAQVYVATLGNSEMSETIAEEEGIELSSLCGKRECFLFQVLKNGSLLIAGSDKRGTIYGLFHISELMGVSPFVHFADVVPAPQKEIIFSEKDSMQSKEPSVKYRGFFINDEWPAFGNWTFSHYGGFTAEMYDLIFETLLRLKGNYLWPAMWTSSFSLDGPGEENARLADCYGIVMSNSHHEPCLRHSEEWDLVRGEDSVYGNEWSYLTNREGLIRYWRDGLLRSGKYENIITIGMRGERDSLMLGEDASLEQNISLLKEIITEQRKLIRECVGENEPEMLALYKEVEAYYYGDETTPGLKDWDGLDGVTLMLCEDNYGNMRTLPTEKMRSHRGGFGMYYHFDYHGSPVSYEWVNSSYLPKIWDQMTMAYDFGVRDIWIVNVGDLKFQEYPLSFFMDLAYDYEKWGSSRIHAPQDYLAYWVKREFGGWFYEAQQDAVYRIMQQYTKMNHNCKPEAMRADTYHPVHFGEADKRQKENERLEAETEKLLSSVPEEMLPAFWELVYYPAMGSANASDMQLYAGKNSFFAKMGAVCANDYAEKIKACIEKDRLLTERFHQLLDGKWDGMALSEHIGFVNWNDEECRYPLMTFIEPANKPRIFAMSEGGDVCTAGGDWTKKLIVMRQFLDPAVSEASLLLFGGSKEKVPYHIECKSPWVLPGKMQGVTDREEVLTVQIKRDEITDWENDHRTYDFEVCYEGGRIPVKILLEKDLPGCPAEAFYETDGMLSVEAEHFICNEKADAGAFYVLPEYGKTLSGVKAYPQTKTFFEMAEQIRQAPKLTYQIYVREAGEYEMICYTAPANPVCQGGSVYFGCAVNGNAPQKIEMIPDGYRSGEPSCAEWAKMVVDQIRVVRVQVTLQSGENEIGIYAGTPGFLLEKLTFVRKGKHLPESGLGLPERRRTNR